MYAYFAISVFFVIYPCVGKKGLSVLGEHRRNSLCLGQSVVSIFASANNCFRRILHRQEYVRMKAYGSPIHFVLLTCHHCQFTGFQVVVFFFIDFPSSYMLA